MKPNTKKTRLKGGIVMSKQVRSSVFTYPNPKPTSSISGVSNPFNEGRASEAKVPSHLDFEL